MPLKEKAICLTKGSVLIILIGYLFYGKIIYGIVFLPYLYFYYKDSIKRYRQRRQDERMREFKDGMQAISSALTAGYSVENSFKKALGELTVLYGDKSEIVQGFTRIVYKLGMNSNTEEAIQDFAEKIEIEDAIYFAEVFRYVKKSGGDMTGIIRKTTENISGRLEVKREIDTMITGRRMEQKVMNAIPFAIIFYIRMGASEFIEPLYGNLMGACVMTGCIMVYFGAVKWAEKLIEIEV